jgi:hypothetical protein
LYRPRKPMHPVGVYFSPESRDYDSKDFLPAYRGTLVMLLQAHREFQVVTPRTVASFKGEKLILPSVSTLSDGERESIRKYVAGGGKLVITGSNRTGMAASERVRILDADPGKAHFRELEKDFSEAATKMPKDFLEAIQVAHEIEIAAPATMAANMAEVEGTPHIFLANFGGLIPSKVAQPTPAMDVRVSIPAGMGDSLTFLPFLGEKQTVRGKRNGGQVDFMLPAVERGAVAWICKP